MKPKERMERDITTLLRQSEELIKSMLAKPEVNQTELARLYEMQRDDGSFAIAQDPDMPSDARVDFVIMPTHKNTAILIRAYLKDSQSVLENLLIDALNASAEIGLRGHGYEATDTLIEILQIYIDCGVKSFLMQYPYIAPKFCAMIQNARTMIESRIATKQTNEPWKGDYMTTFKDIADNLSLSGNRYYVAYGSNMSREQMERRCPDAQMVGRSYLQGWKLTMPFYANIEPDKDARTPVLIWEISESDEARLDKWEGYPNCYDKHYLTVDVDGKKLPALVYIMTEKHKNSGHSKDEKYETKIVKAYVDLGFSLEEYSPRR